jgi:hypothetical protein
VFFLPNDAEAPVNHSEHYETAEEAKKAKKHKSALLLLRPLLSVDASQSPRP